ncbi:MAG: tetratricopeptide repeat protein [Bacteroidota bacterium]
MKKIILILIFPLLANFAFGQNKQEAEKLVEEGIAYHDKGDFDGAISKYDKALELDKDNLLALAEKSLSLLSLKKYDDAIVLCQKAIEKYPNQTALKTVFVTYGNGLDALKKTDKSIEIYDEGIKMFPEYYQLYFNKGISLASVRKNDEALLCFQKSVSINPKHASSNNAIARLLYTQDKNIPSIFAFCRFLILEPQSDRAKGNLALLQKIVKGNVEQTGKNNITIKIDPKMLEDTASNGKVKENSFSSTELILNMTSALDYDKKNSNKTDVEQFIRKFETICTSVEETKNNNFGFYWEYYVPYFIELNKKKLIEPFAYIAFASSDKEDVSKWLKSHQTEIEKFYAWSKNYNWDKK